MAEKTPEEMSFEAGLQDVGYHSTHEGLEQLLNDYEKELNENKVPYIKFSPTTIFEIRPRKIKAVDRVIDAAEIYTLVEEKGKAKRVKIREVLLHPYLEAIVAYAVKENHPELIKENLDVFSIYEDIAEKYNIDDFAK